MKFRYYITALFDGNIQGTDDTVVATNFSLCEDWFVVDAETGEWLTPSGPESIMAVKGLAQLEQEE